MRHLIFMSIFSMATAYYVVDENIDIAEVTGNLIILKKYAACVLDKGPCTKSMSAYKEIIKHAVETECAECSPNQKHLVHEMLKAMLLRLPNDLEQIRVKYDPTGEHVANIIAELQKY